jgi:hypothetical protein
MTTDPQYALSSDDRDYPPGPLAGVKRGAASDPGYPQPQAAEVESARLLANQARQRLHAAGFSDQDIDRLADDFIAEDRGEATGAFIGWAHRVRWAAQAAHGALDKHSAAQDVSGGVCRGCESTDRPADRAIGR